MNTSVNPIQIDVKNDAGAQLDLIEIRLTETLASAVVFQTISEVGDDKALDQHSKFWRSTMLSHQTTAFVGIFAVLDKGSNDSATLYSAAALIEKHRPGVLPSTMVTGLDLLRDRYKTFRHKVFGHNDFHRRKHANDFNNKNITHVALHADLYELIDTMKVLRAVYSGNAVPNMGSLASRGQPIDFVAAQTRVQTEALLSQLSIWNKAAESLPSA